MNIEPCMWCKEPLATYIASDDDGAIIVPPMYGVCCANCGANGPQKETPDEAIKAWNEVARIVREAKEKDNA